MPGIVDWRTTPLQVIDQIFEDHQRTGSAGQTWTKNVEKFFTDKLGPTEWNQIPSLNVSPNHSLVDGQVVRFRGMIQDMFDPELYLSEYEAKDVKTGQNRLLTCRYRDATVCAEDDINFESTSTKNEERLSYFCVAIPGEAAWVSEAYKAQAPNPQLASISNFSRDKRTRDDENEEMDEGISETPQTATIVQSKKSRPENAEQTTSGIANSLGKIPETVQSVIVKFYDLEEGVLSLNDSVEFVGILSTDPSVARAGFEDSAMMSAEGASVELDFVAQFDRKEVAAKNPPTSLVPRLHVLHYVKLDSCNPLLPVSDVTTAPKPDLSSIRAELHSYLTRLLLGDSLTADYLICHLVSRIYLRRDVLCLGKISLNLFQIPLQNDYSKRLSSAIQSLLCKSRYLALTVDNLNKMVYVPKKDYESNRLETGFLQLSPHTHLFLDETALESGQLDAEGVRNLTALGNVISWQKLGYNFSYHSIDFLTDVPCLVLSEGRSILPSDIQLLMKPQQELNIDEMLGTDLSPETLNRFRSYLSYVRHFAEFDVTDEMQTFVQEDFVRERSNSQTSISPDDLHALLVLSRTMALSHGMNTLTEEIWTNTKNMEKMRKERMAHLPVRPGGH